MKEDLKNKIKCLRAQKEILLSSVSRSVERMVASRVEALRREGIAVDDPQVQPIVRKMIEEFRQKELKALLDEETKDIDAKITQYTNLLTDIIALKGSKETFEPI